MDALHVACEELLAAGVEALDSIPDHLGTTFVGAPERVFVSPGAPAIDCCEMLATWTAAIGEGPRSPATQAAVASVNRPQIQLLSLRCIPQGAVVAKKYVPPSADQLTATAEQIHADGWAIRNHLVNLIAAGELFSTCDDFTWGTAPVQDPSGGCAGWRFLFNVEVQGYAEELGT
jgi:hypothetical protein